MHPEVHGTFLWLIDYIQLDIEPNVFKPAAVLGFLQFDALLPLVLQDNFFVFRLILSAFL